MSWLGYSPTSVHAWKHIRKRRTEDGKEVKWLEEEEEEKT